MRSLDRLVPEHLPALEPPGRRLAQRLLDEHGAGTGHALVVREGATVVGAGGLRGLGPGGPAIVDCWINAAARRRGHGASTLDALLLFAFHSLGLERLLVPDAGLDAAGRRLLERAGFTAVSGTGLALTRAGWQARRDAGAIAALHPALRAILAAELAAGNAVAETTRGWPDPESVFVQLRDPFRTRPASMPEGVAWAAGPPERPGGRGEYRTAAPRHVLAG